MKVSFTYLINIYNFNDIKHPLGGSNLHIIKIIINISLITYQNFVAFLALIAVATADAMSHARVMRGQGHEGYSHAIEHYEATGIQGYTRVRKAIPSFKYSLKKTAVPTPKSAPEYKPVTTPEPKAAAPAAPVYKSTPASTPAPVYVRPTYVQPAYKQSAYDDHAKYNFEYEVVDDYAKLNFGQNEGRDGSTTNGGYHVLLPDCRTQVVKYTTADGYSGNVV